MILKLIKKLLNHFNYEVVSFAEITQLNRALSQRFDIAVGTYDLTYLVDYSNGEFIVKTRAGSPVHITDWNQVRIQAAIAAMQAFISTDRYGWSVIEMAVEKANELIEELKKNQYD